MKGLTATGLRARVGAVERVARVFGSFEEADRADDLQYADLTPEERVEILRSSSNATGARLAKLQTDLGEFIALLSSRRVEFLVVGVAALKK